MARMSAGAWTKSEEKRQFRNIQSICKPDFLYAGCRIHGDFEPSGDYGRELSECTFVHILFAWKKHVQTASVCLANDACRCDSESAF